MSKERARRREARLKLTERRVADEQVRRETERARAARRSALSRRRGTRSGRSVRRSARSRERRAIIASGLLVVLVVTYLVFGSVSLVVGVMLVAVIATPALVAVLTDRSKK